jgi:GNAT superfamily N-acetyltransferase
MESIEIRPATLADLPHIVHHRRSMFRDMGRGTAAEIEACVAVTEVFLREAMPNGGYRGWLAETASGVIAAGAGITIVPWPGHPGDAVPRRGWIQNVYTETAFRRQGLARRLMETVVAWCRAEGFHTISLHASADGRPLYQDMGFKATNEMRLDL